MFASRSSSFLRNHRQSWSPSKNPKRASVRAIFMALQEVHLHKSVLWPHRYQLTVRLGRHFPMAMIFRINLHFPSICFLSPGTADGTRLRFAFAVNWIKKSFRLPIGPLAAVTTRRKITRNYQLSQRRGELIKRVTLTIQLSGAIS